MTIGVVRGSASDDVSRDCIDALRQYAPRAELVILEPRADEPLGRSYNRLLRITDSDYLVLMSDRYRIEGTWLESLLSAMWHKAAIVTPLIWDLLGRPSYTGIALEPTDADKGGPRELLTLPGDFCLLDTARCRDLLFDERYSRYFAGLDFSLRAWERNIPIACVPGARVTRLFGCRPRGLAAASRFERDHKLFADLWLTNGRAAKLGGRLAVAVRELDRLDELSRAVPDLYRRRLVREYGRLPDAPRTPVGRVPTVSGADQSARGRYGRDAGRASNRRERFTKRSYRLLAWPVRVSGRRTRGARG